MADRPSIQDEEKYEALRDKGYRKGTAARIANAGDEAARRGGRRAPYEEWTKDELYERARELDVAGRSKMRKQELIAALRDER